MNELRWILLGVGVLVIAGIYFYDVIKQKRNIRSRVEKYPGFNHEGISTLSINPKKERNIDISGALAAFNSYLRQSRTVTRHKDDGLTNAGRDQKFDEDKEPVIASEIQSSDGTRPEQQIIVIYIIAQAIPRFYGNDILDAMNTVDMHYGDMQIFHYHGPDKNHSTRALFSLANMHEPGTFDLDNMDSFITDGLALFMCLPAEIGGDIAFEIMLDTAQNLAQLLGGELHASDRSTLDSNRLNKLREIAGQY